MKTPEDEAFDEIAKRQGGFRAKRAMAANKLQEDQAKYGTSWSKDGERIDPMSVYKEPEQLTEKEKISREMTAEIAAARELAQPAQKPVAHIPLKALEQIKPPMLILNNVPIYGYGAEGTVAVYTAPPQRPWVGLTVEEIKKLSDDCVGVRDETEFIRAIAQALKEKNT